MSDYLWPHGLQPGSTPWDFPGKNTEVGCHFLLQGIFPTQESNPCLLHWQADSLPLSHQGSPIVFPGSETYGDFWQYIAESCWFICRLFLNRGNRNNKSGILILIKWKKLSIWLYYRQELQSFCLRLEGTSSCSQLMANPHLYCLSTFSKPIFPFFWFRCF